jgi:NAD+ diphosphatase
VSAPILPYSGNRLDRAAGNRGDPRWIATVLAAPTTRVLPLWQEQCLLAGSPPVPLMLGSEAAQAVVTAADDVVFLGLDGGAGRFAADLSALQREDALRLAGASGAADVRAIVQDLDPATAALIAYGRGLLHWTRQQRYCGACGSRTEPRDGGQARGCVNSACARLLFPRIEPAVIMLVETPDEPRRCLLARHKGAAPGRFAMLAGFVEIGESLEDAVRRELAEEAGVSARSIRYVASQAWPFPAGIMLGFRVVAAGDTTAVDGEELVEARWFTAADLHEYDALRGGLGRPDAIDRFLLRSWLAETHGPTTG